MELTIKINLDNEAFAEWPANEVSRILKRFADEIPGDRLKNYDQTKLYDYNGNHVGLVELSEDETMEYTLLDTENYFDQSEAVHTFLTLNHEGQWSKKYELLCRSEFSPGPLWSEENVVNENEFYSTVETWDDEEIERFFDELDHYLEHRDD